MQCTQLYIFRVFSVYCKVNSILVFKGIVHPKNFFFLKREFYSHLGRFLHQNRLEKYSITSLAHQWILCSEWVPSEWVQTAESKHYYGLWTCILSRTNGLKSKPFDGFVSYKHTVLSAVWTLILTAPIHCRGSIGEQVK